MTLTLRRSMRRPTRSFGSPSSIARPVIVSSRRSPGSGLPAESPPRYFSSSTVLSGRGSGLKPPGVSRLPRSPTTSIRSSGTPVVPIWARSSGSGLDRRAIRPVEEGEAHDDEEGHERAEVGAQGGAPDLRIEDAVRWILRVGGLLVMLRRVPVILRFSHDLLPMRRVHTAFRLEADCVDWRGGHLAGRQPHARRSEVSLARFHGRGWNGSG